MTDQLAHARHDLVGTDDPTTNDDAVAARSGRSVDERLAPPRRRWPALLAGVAVGIAGTLVVRSTIADDDAGAASVDPVEVVGLATATVERRDLVEEVDWAGVLAVGESTTIGAPTAGTLTDVVADGAVIERGDSIARIDDRPVVALFGATPMWRDLTVGSEGDDVIQLETNLVALGFDPDRTVTIDTTYTSATADMVDAWQESLGIEATGTVAVRDVIVLAGASTLSAPSPIGSPLQVGDPIAAIETPAITVDIVARAFETDGLEVEEAEEVEEVEGSEPAIDAIAEPGTAVEHGTVLFVMAGVEVVAVIDVSPETSAVLTALESGDVEEIESVLALTGFDPTDEMEIDDEVDVATAAAVVRWQESIGLPSTGSVQAAAYVVVPGDREYAVAEPVAVIGDAVGEGRLVTTLESATLSLTADVVVSEVDEFDVGAPVVVEQVDGSTFRAIVTDIAETTSRSAQDDPTVVVTFGIVESPDAFVSGSVVLTSESSRIDDATVVPTRALVTLREGGFAVERVDDGGARTLVGVELGTFDDGVVEIVGGDLEPGDRVVVPS